MASDLIIAGVVGVLAGALPAYSWIGGSVRRAVLYEGKSVHDLLGRIYEMEKVARSYQQGQSSWMPFGRIGLVNRIVSVIEILVIALLFQGLVIRDIKRGYGFERGLVFLVAFFLTCLTCIWLGERYLHKLPAKTTNHDS